MSYVKIPSLLKFFDLTKRRALAFKESFQPTALYTEDKHASWQNLCLHMHFIPDSLADLPISSEDAWKSFFFETALNQLLNQKGGNASLFDLKQKRFWAKDGAWVKRLSLNAQEIKLDGLKTLAKWLCNLEELTIEQFWIYEPSLGQPKNCLISALEMLPQLKTLKLLKCAHLDKKALPALQQNLCELIISDAEAITTDFFLALRQFEQLHTLKLLFCKGLEANHLHYLSPNLKELDLNHSCSQLLDSSLAAIPDNLRKLNLDGFNTLHKGSLKLLPRQLEELSLYGCLLDNSSVSELTSFASLSSLSIRNCGPLAISKALQHIPTSIQSLDIGENFIEDSSSLKILTHFDRLETLYLDHCPRNTKHDFNDLEIPQSLKCLSLAGAGTLPDRFFDSLERSFLQMLSLSRCQILNKYLSALPNSLEELDLSYNASITDDGLELISELKDLSCLALNRCDQIRGFGFSFLPKALRKLFIKGCHRFSGKSLSSLTLPLMELHLEQCELVENEDLKFLPKTLQTLNISGCKKLDDSIFDTLKCLPHLSTLYVENCPLITEKGILKFIENGFLGRITGLKKISNVPSHLRYKLFMKKGHLEVMSDFAQVRKSL